MASFAPIRGTRAQIQATPIVDGQFLIETDQGVDNMIYIDEGSTRTIVGGNTVSGVLPELYIYSETGSVVTVEDAGGNIIPTSQVGTDHWTCELPDYGVYTVTSVLSGETTTQSIDVNDCMIYTIDASHFHVNVVVTYPSGVGASCQISGGGETYSAPALNPPNTSYKFVVHGKNTTYTITTTVDGATKTATVTSGTTIDQTYEVTMSYGQINLTVETPPITGDITCTDGVTTIIKPASANMVFYVPNTGTWDISGSDGSITYSTSAIVTSLSTPVSAGLNTGLDLSAWITAGSTTEYPLNPSSYANFAALEADEAAIRQLMLVHDAVDYLATAPAGDNLMQNVINSDICAKWINLSDYALDTLSANSDIKSVMDTADKYGYGEWGKNEIASNGSASASASASGYEANYAFTPIGSDSGWYISGAAYTNAWLKCDLGAKTKVTDVITYIQATDNTPTMTITFSGSDDDVTYTPIKTGIVAHAAKEITALDATVDYRYYKWEITAFTGSSSNTSGFKANLVSWQPLGNVPIMTANNAPYGTVSNNGSIYGSNSAWKAFDGNVSTYFNANSYGGAQPYIKYDFVTPIKPKKCTVKPGITDNANIKSATYTLKGSNDGGTTWSDSLGQVVSEAGKSSVYTISAEADTYYMTLGLFLSAPNWDNTDVIISDIQFYGRELKPLVPTMTSDTTPRGEIVYSSQYNNTNHSALRVFDGNKDSESWWPSSSTTTFDNTYVGYKFEAPVKPDKIGLTVLTYGQTGVSVANYLKTFQIRASNDNFATSHNVTSVVTTINKTGEVIYEIEPDDYYAEYRLYALSNEAGADSVAIRELQFYGSDYNEKEFAPGSTRKTIYDHGVAPNGIHLIAGSTGGMPVDDGNQITVTSPNSAALSNYSLIQSDEAVNMGNYDYMHVRYGNRFVYDSANRFHLGAWKTKMTGQNYANSDIDIDIDLMTTIPLTALEDILDITQISATEYPAYYASYTRAAVTASITELWLE